MSQEKPLTEAAAVQAEVPATVDGRAAALVERMRAESRDENASADADVADDVAASTLTDAAPPEVDPKAERAKRLDAYRAREKEAQERRNRHKAGEQERQAGTQAIKERDALRQRVAALEAIESDIKDPAKFIELAKRAGVAPDALGAYIRDSISDPSAHAEKRAREAINPELDRVKAYVSQLEAKLDALVSERVSERAGATEQAARETLVDHVRSNEADSPLLARYRSVYSTAEFNEFAEVCAASLQPGAGLQALIDVMESQLEQLGRVYTSATGSPASPGTGNPRNHAAAKANTLSNRAAQGRASVVDEVDPSSLPIEERIARLKRKLDS